jgi:hypothetical protein
MFHFLVRNHPLPLHRRGIVDIPLLWRGGILRSKMTGWSLSRIRQQVNCSGFSHYRHRKGISGKRKALLPMYRQRAKGHFLVNPQAVLFPAVWKILQILYRHH